MVVDVEEVNGRLPNDALLQVDDETVLGEAGEQRVQVLHVLSHVPAGHQTVIEVDKQERQVGEDSIHQPPESLGCILEAERHVKELKKTEWGDDNRLGDVVRMLGPLSPFPHKVMEASISAVI